VFESCPGDDDYDGLKAKLNDWNRSNKKRENSFHADEPRRTRGKCKFSEAMNSLRPVSRKPNMSSKSGSGTVSRSFRLGLK